MQSKFIWLDIIATDRAMRGLPTSLANVLANRYVNGKSLEVWPGAYTLAEILSAQRKNIQVAQKKLVGGGYLTKTRDGGGSDTARFRISVPSNIKDPGENASKREKLAGYIRITSVAHDAGSATVPGCPQDIADACAHTEHTSRDTPTSVAHEPTSVADNTAPVLPTTHEPFDLNPYKENPLREGGGGDARVPSELASAPYSALARRTIAEQAGSMGSATEPRGRRVDLIDAEIARKFGDVSKGYMILLALSPEKVEYLRSRQDTGTLEPADLAEAAVCNG